MTKFEKLTNILFYGLIAVLVVGILLCNVF